jgi:hypothetical protein
MVNKKAWVFNSDWPQAIQITIAYSTNRIILSQIVKCKNNQKKIRFQHIYSHHTTLKVNITIYVTVKGGTFMCRCRRDP